MTPSNVSWSRSSALASIAAVILAFSITSIGPPSSVATIFASLISSAARRAISSAESVGGMDRAEKIGGFEARFVDPPQEAIGIEEVVGARGLGRGEPLDVGERVAVTGLGGRGLRRRKAQQADKPRAEAECQSPHRAHSFLRATSSIRWLAPFVKRRSARGRVGRIFSCRLTRLMRRQIDRAVASASASPRSAYWRK